MVNAEDDDHMERAATTVPTPEGVHDSGNGTRTQSMATQDIEMPMDSSIVKDLVDINVSSGTNTKNKGASISHARHDAAGGSSDPSKEVNTFRDGEDSSVLNELTNTFFFCCSLLFILKIIISKHSISSLNRSMASSSSSDILPIAEKHNVLVFFKKAQGSDDYHGMIDFLINSNLKEALTVNPIINISHINDFWTSAAKSEVEW